MVLQERIELSTSPLPRECSTTELLQGRQMTKEPGAPSKADSSNTGRQAPQDRKKRLAEALRRNLPKRRQQKTGLPRTTNHNPDGE
jgi:hypothetical protein